MKYSNYLESKNNQSIKEVCEKLTEIMEQEFGLKNVKFDLTSNSKSLSCEDIVKGTVTYNGHTLNLGDEIILDNIIETISYIVHKERDKYDNDFVVANGSYNGHCDGNIKGELLKTCKSNGIHITIVENNGDDSSIKEPARDVVSMIVKYGIDDAEVYTNCEAIYNIKGLGNNMHEVTRQNSNLSLDGGHDAGMANAIKILNATRKI